VRTDPTWDKPLWRTAHGRLEEPYDGVRRPAHALRYQRRVSRDKAAQPAFMRFCRGIWQVRPTLLGLSGIPADGTGWSA